MSEQTDNDTQRTRIYFTGDCEGFTDLRDALANHPELEVVGWSDHVAQAAGVLAGGHLNCILHGTRAESFPGGRGRRDPRADALADHHRRLEHGDRAARGGARGRGRRRARPAAADRERRVRHPQVGACEAPALDGRALAAGPGRDRVLAEGRHGQDRHRLEPGCRAREAGSQDAAARPRPAVRRRRDRDGHRAREDDLRPRRRAGRARHREARRLHDQAPVRARHPPRAAAPRGRGARDRVEDHPAARGRARVLRRDRRRHLAVLPRPDARDARPHGRAARALRARRPDAQERPARAADARAAVVPADRGSATSSTAPTRRSA